jgi:hypothetical protein
LIVSGYIKKGTNPPKPAEKSCQSKKAEVLTMMKRPNGATLAEIMAMTGWQAHTVRASSAFSAAGEGRKSNLQRMTQASGLYRIAK